MSPDIQYLPLAELVELSTERITGDKSPNLPYVGLEHIAQGEPRLLGVAPSETSTSTNSVFYGGDILFGKLRPNLRKSLQVDFEGYCSTDILVLRSQQGVDSGFASRILQGEAVFRRAVQTAIGTKMPRTSWDDLKPLNVYVPPLPEQRGIAEILDAADEAIRQTERVIAKLKEVKAGLLHDLLTRGLDEHGRLRDPVDHPEQFKDSPTGRIPREWEAITLGTSIDFITDYRGRTPPYVNEGIPVISAENIGSGRIKSITKYVTPQVYRKWTNRGFPEPDDVIFTTEAPVGEVALLPADQVYLLTRRVIALRPNVDLVRKRFLYWNLFRLSTTGTWDAFTHGSTVPRILKPDILGLRFLCPPLAEQDATIIILDAHDTRIRAEEAALAKLRQVKRGLMDDLLSGRVRVQT